MHNMWHVPKIWQGGDVWIIGGGPSLTKQFNIPDDIVESVRNGTSPLSAYSPYMSAIHDKHVIGVNVAFMIGDWIDMVFFGDGGFFLQHMNQLAAFPNLRIGAHNKAAKSRWVKYLARQRGKKYGISTSSSHVCWNENSGAAAISVAAHAGAKRIILVGFDMSLDEKQKHHWHGVYRKGGIAPSNTKVKRGKVINNVPFHRHLAGFPQIKKDASKLGIEIINACPESKIECFRKTTVKDVLNGY